MLYKLKAFADNKLKMTKFVCNCLPNDKVLDWSKLKAFADDKINVTYKKKFFFRWVENIGGKAENAG